MPVYEFICQGCNKKFAVTKPVSRYNPKAVKCPGCHGKKVERRWSSISVQTAKKS